MHLGRGGIFRTLRSKVRPREKHLSPDVKGPDRVVGDALDRFPFSVIELVDRAVAVCVMRRLKCSRWAGWDAKRAAECRHERSVHKALAKLHWLTADVLVQREERG